MELYSPWKAKFSAWEFYLTKLSPMKTDGGGSQEWCCWVLGGVGSICTCLWLSDPATVICVLVTSRLNYCSVFSLRLSLKSAWKLQNNVTTLLFEARYHMHMTPILQQLHWLVIHSWCYIWLLKPFMALNIIAAMRATWTIGTMGKQAVSFQ